MSRCRSIWQRIRTSGAPACPALFKKKIFCAPSKQPKFHGIQIEDFPSEAYQTVEGIEFRAVTVTAYKGKEGPCIERNQAVIYRGPWKQVVDDDGHTLERGARMAVCDKTFKLYSSRPTRTIYSRAAARRGCRGEGRRVRLREGSQALSARDQGIGVQSHANIRRGLRAGFELLLVVDSESVEIETVP